MKTTSACVPQLLLAGLLALPLLAMHRGAHAAEADRTSPPLLQGGPGIPPGNPAGYSEGMPLHGVPGEPGAPGGEAGRGHGSGRGPHGGMPALGEPGPGAQPPFLRGLELSSAQQDKVFAILHAQAPYLYEQGKAAGQAHEGLRALARAEQYDDAKAVALAKDAGNAMANLALQRVRTEQKLLAILTPEQRKKLAARVLQHSALQPHPLPPHALPPQGRP